MQHSARQFSKESIRVREERIVDVETMIEHPKYGQSPETSRACIQNVVLKLQHLFESRMLRMFIYSKGRAGEQKSYRYVWIGLLT